MFPESVQLNLITGIFIWWAKFIIVLDWIKTQLDIVVNTWMVFRELDIECEDPAFKSRVLLMERLYKNNAISQQQYTNTGHHPRVKDGSWNAVAKSEHFAMARSKLSYYSLYYFWC